MSAGLALGTVQWGQKYGIANRIGSPTVQEVAKMLKLARGAGIRFLDTARAYGESERVIGETTDGDLHWSIVTKLAPDVDTSEQVALSLEISRFFLRRETLDAVLLHRWSTRSSVWDVLRRERDAERITCIGGSAIDCDDAWAMLEDQEVEVIQVPASLFDQRLSRAGFFEKAAALGKKVFVRSIFLQGAAHIPPDQLPQHLAPLRETTSSVRQWAADRECSAAIIFLAFAASLPGVWVLLGCESVAQLAENLRNWDTARSLTDEVETLAATVPELPVNVLNPAYWPKL